MHTDLGLALVAQAWRARDDLRVVVMSATMDPAPVRAYLDDCPLVDVPGVAAPARHHLRSGPERSPTRSPTCCLQPRQRALLPAGRGRDRRARSRRRSRCAHRYGDRPAAAARLARRRRAGPRARPESGTRRVIFATNIAETSLTVPGVSAVIDTGLQKVARYDAERAIDGLVLERVTADSADQRAGRAARLGPGQARRLWDRRDRLRPAREPEIHRVDLAGILLGTDGGRQSAGGLRLVRCAGRRSGRGRPHVCSRASARSRGDTVTPLGHQLRRLPLHPRLGRVLIARAARLGGGRRLRAAVRTTRAPTGGYRFDVVRPATADRSLVTRAAPHATRRGHAASTRPGPSPASGARRTSTSRDSRRALLAGYPDRVARRRPGDRTRVLLASGRGAADGTRVRRHRRRLARRARPDQRRARASRRAGSRGRRASSRSGSSRPRASGSTASTRRGHGEGVRRRALRRAAR